MKHEVTTTTWAEINLDNIKFNLYNIKSLINEDTKICAVMKADAYGHGSVEIAKVLEKEKIDYFAVARLEEAIELRQHDITLPILCLGYVPEEILELGIKNKISMTVYSLNMAEQINKISERMDLITNVHIKIDTGMSRIGFHPNELTISDILKIKELKYIYLEGIFTHFATADEASKEFTYNQAKKFKFVVEKLEEVGVKIPIKHAANSASIMDCPDLDFDMVRCGIILYGHYPSDDVFKQRLKIKPAMKLKTRISYIKDVDPGIGISYGLKYETRSKEKIATIAIGYADGFTRMQHNPKVYIKGEVFDVVGRICMDQCMVKIDKDIDIKIGDEVIIFGEDNMTVSRIAKDLNTIDYEVLCMISRRVNRVYMEENAIVQVSSYLVK